MLKFLSISFSFLKGKGQQFLGKYFLLALIPFIALQSPVFAQPFPVSAYYEPAEFEDGDEISIHLKLGNAQNQIHFAQALQVKISYELFDVDPQSEIGHDAGSPSWFGADGNYYGDQYVDHENQQIVLNLYRSNGEAVSGFGYTARLYGIIVEMDEILGKNGIQPGAIEISVLENLRSKLGIVWRYVPEVEQIQLDNLGESEIQEIRIYDLQGKLLMQKDGAVENISTSSLSAQVYILEINTSQGSFAEKVWVK